MRQFRPPLWAVMGVVPLTALLLSLGVWQLQRGLAKAEIEATYQASDAETSPVELSRESEPPAEGKVVKARFHGRFDSQEQLLLDHQTHDRRPGYRVWTVMRGDEFDVLVDRGWLAASADRAVLPEVSVGEEARQVSGYWRSLPAPALRLEADPCSETGFPRVVTYPSHEQVQCILGPEVLPGVLLMDDNLPDGFVREWTMPNPVPPTRHYGYAAQWFAFAATLVFLFIKLNLKPSRPE